MIRHFAFPSETEQSVWEPESETPHPVPPGGGGGVIVPVENLTDPAVWVDILMRESRRVRRTPVEIWRDAVAPRIGIPYPLGNYVPEIPIGREWASKIDAFARAVQICVDTIPNKAYFDFFLQNAIDCTWCNVPGLIREMELIKIRYDTQ